jgi:hypothetical protein
MWKIIKTEYYYMYNLYGKWLLPFLVLLVLSGKIFFDFLFNYILIAGAVLTLQNDNRYYMYQTLPIKYVEIAYARIIMLIINFTVLTLLFYIINIIVPLIKFSLLFLSVTSLILIRLYTFILFDIISGMRNKTKKTMYILLFAITLAAIIFLLFLGQNRIQYYIIAWIFLLTVISIKTFKLKEFVVVKEQYK